MFANNKLYLCSDNELNPDKVYENIVDIPQYQHTNKNGIMLTYFVNIIDFSNSIDIDKVILLCIIEVELLCSTGFDNDNQKYYLTGLYEDSVLNNIICKFIKNYILCKICDKPFVKFRLRHKCIRQKCFKCGAKKYIDPSLEKTNVYKMIKSIL